ncbi:tripartite tricarboxylate transporter TctB family protein [Arachnia propionica]|uniref:DUF1468 domain-containing protein n=1 Tax=Arachnia propionica TaxID=1750 RepID=A0A3P1X001_9ACTN|nr:tripartite tricarboxylate transporter TctB family protein [Arachnia propionica]RRD51000.1 hypothetical protein EII35_02830 [Arachnia propionica]
MTEAVGGEGSSPPVTAAPSRPLEVAASLAVVVLGVAMFLGARIIRVRNETGGIDPRWWPGVIGAGIAVMGLWMLVDAVRAPISREVAPAQRSGWVQMAATVAGLGVVLLLWQIGVSFLVLGPGYLVVMNWVFRLRTWRSLLLFPGIVLVLLLLVFQMLLKVPL